MATLSTTAWVLHDLGLAAGFGGNLFGQLALNPSVAAVDDKRERGRVAHVAWSRYKSVNAISLLAFASTWSIGRLFLNLTGREVGRTSRKLTLVKDGLVTGAFVAGVGSMIAGTLLDKARVEAGEAPIETGAVPAEGTPRKVASLQRITNAFGIGSIVFQAAVLATTTVLAIQSGKSKKWSFVSKYFLP